MTHQNLETRTAKPHDPFDQLFDERALANRWRISVRTLQNRRVSGQGIPFIKIGRSVRYRLSDIVGAEAAGRRTNTSEGQSDE